MVFECSYYQIIRMGFPALFRMDMINGSTIVMGDTGDMMRRFFAHKQQTHVAKFISMCLRAREDYLRQLR
jgi:hypothetical protein